MTTDNPLSAMVEHDKDELVRQKIVEVMEDRGIVRNCPNCDHFCSAREVCTMWGCQRPPAHVIARGCPSWEPDIPF